MPLNPASETALIVIAVAVSVQTLLTLGIVVGAVVAWKRAQATLEDRYQALSARVDNAVKPLQDAADAIHRVSDRASDAIGQAGRVAGAVSTFVTAPRNLAMMGAASLASIILKWRRGRTTPLRHAAKPSSVVH